jgi:hypothetical protein
MPTSHDLGEDRRFPLIDPSRGSILLTIMLGCVMHEDEKRTY